MDRLNILRKLHVIVHTGPDIQGDDIVMEKDWKFHVPL